MLLALQNQTSSVRTKGINDSEEQNDTCVTNGNKAANDSISEITIAIGSSSQTYSTDKLKQLAFFDALCSNRWLSNINKTKPIQILPINSNDNHHNNTNSINQFILKSKQFNFNCNDLSLLLKCFELNKIPSDLLEPELDKVESLLYCNDFLNPTDKNDNSKQSKQSKQSKHKNIITYKVLMQYFRQCKHKSLDKERLQLIRTNCTHPMLKSVLNQLNNEYTNELENARIQAAKMLTTCNYKKLKNVSFNTNEKFAKALFEAHFRVDISIKQIKNDNVAWVDFMHSSSPDNKRTVKELCEEALIIRVTTPSIQDTTVPPSRTAKTSIKNINDDINSIFNENKNNQNGNKYDIDIIHSHDGIGPGYISNCCPLMQVWYFGKCFKNISGDVLKIIDNTMAQLLTKESMIGYIDCSFNDAVVLREIFESLSIGIMSNEIDTNNSKFIATNNVGDVKSLVMAQLTILHRRTTSCFMPETGRICRQIEYLGCNANRCKVYSPIDEILSMICRFTKTFFNGLICNVEKKVKDNNYAAQQILDYLTSMKRSAVAWIRMIKCCLQYCSPKYMRNINNTRTWFKIIHLQFRRALKLMFGFAKKSPHFVNDSIDNWRSLEDVDMNNDGDVDENNAEDKDDSKSEITNYDQTMLEQILNLEDRFEERFAKWILDKVVSKFPRQSKFNFGIYLSEFAVFEDKEALSDECNQRYFPKVYVDFMREQCGIDWCITSPVNVDSTQ